jgi:two-component system, sensor histidine kinase
VRIPRSNLLEVQPRGNVPLQAAARRGKPRRARARLLLLEDNQSVRVATELFLSLEGYGVRSAPAPRTLRSCSDLSARRCVDLGLSARRQAHRPRGAAQAARRQGWDVPAVLLSGDLESMLRAVKAPIENCRFLSKPVDTQALLEAIGELSKLPGDA